MARPVETLAAEPDDQSSTPRTLVWKERTNSHTWSPGLHTWVLWLTHINPHTHPQKSTNKSV